MIMAVTDDEVPDVKIKQEEINGHAKGPRRRRKKRTSTSTGSHVTSVLARSSSFLHSPYYFTDQK
jgi:hypothetical protein